MSGIEWASPALNPVDDLTPFSEGTLEVLGLLPYSSNYVFLTKVVWGEMELHAVYKPVRGEKPLWDFPSGTLAAREVAAYEVSVAGGFGFVPPTVMRVDAPLGPGSIQLFIPHDPERHYFVLLEEDPESMASLAALDVVINNADRKGGHVIEGEDGRLWGVDHGLTFNIEPKLRTVIWAFAEQPIPPFVLEQLEELRAAFTCGELPARLAPLLSQEEIAETEARLEYLLLTKKYPAPEGRFSIPWPLV